MQQGSVAVRVIDIYALIISFPLFFILAQTFYSHFRFQLEGGRVNSIAPLHADQPRSPP